MNISTENIMLQMASVRGDIISTLIGTAMGGEDGAASFADILGEKSSSLDAMGRNPSLHDPESAYKMMTQINRFDVNFKAQHAELTELGKSVEHMEDVGRNLADIDTSTSNADIAAQLQAFVAEYNAWEDRFDDTVAQGGVLDNVQAAEVSLWELEQSISSIFNGAAGGVSGLDDLGIEINPVTKQASFDSARLEALLASNRSGAVSAIDEFSANFAKSADLLNSEGNFIPNALNNRSRAIDFIADNLTSLQQEFGSGDAAKPAGETARALSAYNAAFAI
jgi:hypothetical protein